ncbi:MAG: hypothetical protein GY894_09155 [Planctomycetes bacterium]|nr:hypothetical protein [Planctomycetota bacterium]MCP4839510.1 hypothetical protein [Planctomycetota bacterium]
MHWIDRRSAAAHIVVGISIAVCSAAATAEIWTVDDSGGADFMDIQSAVNAANFSGDEIVVAPGVYTGSGNEVVDMLGKAVTLRASGTAAKTIISGESTRLVIRCDSGETASTVIEGFTISFGWEEFDLGAGILCNASSSPTVTGCVLTDNETGNSGGGIACIDNSSPIFIGCTVSSNSANFGGGGVMCSSSCNPTFMDCIIENNTTSLGGGVAIYTNSNPVFSNCSISLNTATYWPWGGGGVYCAIGCSATFSDCDIIGNVAPGRGVGVWADASDVTLINCDISQNDNTEDDAPAGIQFSAGASGLLWGCMIAENTGGGLGFDDSDGSVTNCWIQNNSIVGGLGGGIQCDNSSSPTITDCTIWRNSSDDGTESLGNGGGLSCTDSSNPIVTGCIISENVAGWSPGMSGGGVECVQSSPAFVDCTIVSNESSSAGGAIRVSSGSDVSIVDSALDYNYAPYGGAVIAGSDATVSLIQCSLSSNTGTVFGGGIYTFNDSIVLVVESVIARNDAPAGGGIYSDSSVPVSILESTIWCNTIDQIGGSWADFGGVTIAETCPLDCPDITLDGAVGVEDLLMVMVDWGDSTASDVDDSGVVDMVDLAAILEAWGPC